MTSLLTLISVLSALIYGFRFCYRDASALKSVVKTGAIALLALIAAFHGGPLMLVAALVFSALGDLALSRDGERAFLTGLCSFALAHVFYIVLFAGLAVGWPAVLPVTALALYAVATEFWLAPHTGEMRWPVRIYVLLITGMGLTALALPDALVWALMGAGAFVASDTLLAVQLFRLGPENPWQRPISHGLWGLYYLAQALILWAFIG